MFGRGLRVKYINGKSMDAILDGAWFTNKDTSLEGRLEFDNMKFKHLELKVSTFRKLML